MYYSKYYKWYIIYPENPFKYIWDIFMTIVLVYSCFIIPIQLSFDLSQTRHLVIGWIIDACFILDMIIIFRTAYLTEDFEVIDSRNKIAWNYVTGFFIVDLMAVLPFEYMLPAEEDTSATQTGDG